jgi:hypothetical protein
MGLTLRDKIAVNVSHAIQGTIEYPVKQKVDLSDPNSAKLIKENMEDYYQNRANWVNIATDAILEAFDEFLPAPVEMNLKYELSGDSGVHVVLKNDRTETENSSQLEYLARFADDKGFNRCVDDIRARMKDLYRVRNHHHTIEEKSD